jgi:RNA polymerase sigma-70 factor (ECF subfamily)
VMEKVYLEEKSHQEVSEELAIPLGTVKSRIRLALDRLREAIDDPRS